MTAGPGNSIFLSLPCIVSRGAWGMGVLGREKGPLAPGLGVERSHEVPSIPRSRRNFGRPISPGEKMDGRGPRELDVPRRTERRRRITSSRKCHAREEGVSSLHRPSCACASGEVCGCGADGDAEEARVCRHRSVSCYELGFCNSLADKTLRNSFPPL